MTTQQSIVLVQSPIIEHKLKELGKEVTRRIDELNLENQIVSEDVISDIKKLRADLNKEARLFEDQRKAIKKSIMQPFDEFEELYKEEIINKYKSADGILREKISTYEDKLKQDKEEELRNYFNEMIEFENLDWLTFDKVNLNITLTASLKSYKEQIKSFVDKVIQDLELIDSESDKDSVAEMLVEYKQSLNVSSAMTNVRARRLKAKEEKERRLFDRTEKRKEKLLNIAFVSNSLTRTLNWIHDENVMIKLSDVEQLSDEEFNSQLMAFEKKHQEKQQSLIGVKAPTIVQPEPKKEEVKQEEILEASFTVKGTYAELMRLSEFLKSNNYQYENI